MDDNPFDDIDDNPASDAEVDEFLRKIETPNVINQDNELLQPWGRTGHVDEVNGPGAVEVPEFVPTRHELFQLAKVWVTILLDMNFFWFLYEQTGCREARLKPFAIRRLDRIEKQLGEDLMDKACKEAEDEFAKTVDAEAWRVFRNGTPEERAAFQEEVQREIHRAVNGGEVG
jgi:hypothetical protein